MARGDYMQLTEVPSTTQHYDNRRKIETELNSIQHEPLTYQKPNVFNHPLNTTTYNSEPALLTMKKVAARAEFKVSAVMNPTREHSEDRKIHPWQEPEKQGALHGI